MFHQRHTLQDPLFLMCVFGVYVSGVFATPKLRWRRDELADPEEKRVLDMIGFLLDAYDKKAWWWEVFEMNRKLMLAGEGVQQTRWRVDLPWSAWG